VTLRLRDTLTRRAQAVEPLVPGRVGMYTCGPTVYRYAHVGNLRSYLLADLIRRTLLYHGLEVLHVKNITDVGHLRDERFDRGEDRMLVAAGLESKTPAEIADAYEAAFHADEAAVGILPAHVFPRATEHVADMLALVERLEDSGHAYRSPARNIYFSVASVPGYGRLSGNDLEALRAGHRGDVEPDKRDPADFALWKAAGEGRLLRWPSRRWGEGFPGWHIECSAMSARYLGPRFDIHTGGIDNVFPHHEDEIAQSLAAWGEVPARLWVHGEFLTMTGRKMAKSAGNFERITAVADRGLDPLAYRYLALGTRYRHRLDYSDRSLRAAAAGLESLRDRVRAFGPPPDDGPWQAPPVLEAGEAPARPEGLATATAGHGTAGRLELADRAHAPAAPLSTAGRSLHERFVAAIDDDLDLPTALAVVREMLRAPLAVDERRWLILDADVVLGLGSHRLWRRDGASGAAAIAAEAPGAVPADVRDRLDERASAREARDFATADRIRAELAAEGWEIVDAPEGSTARRAAEAPRSRR